MVVSDMENLDRRQESPAPEARVSYLPAECARVVPVGGRRQRADLAARRTPGGCRNPFADVRRWLATRPKAEARLRRRHLVPGFE
jgi:hypothetical protein